MKLSLSKSQTIRYSIAGTFLAMVVGFALYYYFRYDPTWDEIKSMIQDAPAWIFITAFILLPPLGTPLSIFLFVIGARFGILGGILLSTVAIAAHHILALTISLFLSGDGSPTESQTNIWKKLEEKSGGNASKLLFLWGLLPGLPYLVKLYLPLTMGVEKRGYLQWNTLGHLIGAFLFVGLGSALFSGKNLLLIIVLVAAVALSIGLKVFRNRLSRNAA